MTADPTHLESVIDLGAAQDPLVAYVPRLLHRWDIDREQPWAELPGTLMSVDIVGFTALSERLAAFGRRGSEEVTALVNSVFTEAIDTAEQLGGDILTFGGDGLIVWFQGDDAAATTTAAARAAMQMQRQIAVPRSSASVTDIRLEMSIGIHTGTVWFFTVHPGHRDLVVTGPGAAATVRAESAAAAGQVLMTDAAAASLPDGTTEPAGGPHHVLRADPRPIVLDEAAAPAAPGGSAPPDPVLPAADLFVPAGQAALVRAGVGTGEHRIVTSAFVRIADLDERIERDGPAEVHQRLDQLTRVLGRALAQTGVHWIQSDAYPGGAKLLLAAGAPTSTGDDEAAMLRCLRHVVDAGVDLDLRIGVNRGPTFGGDVGSVTSRRAYAVMSDDVNLAARLMGKAAPGAEVVATQALLDLVDAPVEADPLEPFMVKGKSAPIDAAVVRGVGRREMAGPAPADEPFVGRDAEIGQLLAAARAAAGKAGGAVVVSGDAGLGKSTLVREACARQTQLQLRAVRADRYEANTPYALAARLLRRLCDGSVLDTPEALAARAAPHLGEDAALLPLLGPVVGVDVPPTTASAAIEAAFVQSRAAALAARWVTGEVDSAGPTLLLVEDLHEADDASRSVLDQVVRRAADHALLVLMSTRPSTPPDGAQLMDLAPLDADAQRQLAREIGSELPDRTLDAMIERAGGNPLFVRQLLAAVEAAGSTEELPDTLDALITARLDTLDVQDRLVLQDAGVLGSRVRLDLLERVRDAATPEGWTARTADFLAPVGPDALEFRHDLYREAAYGSLAFERRAALHRLVGLALEAEGADDAVLALHFDRGEDARRTWRYAVRAGLAARDAHAVSEAQTLLAAALGRAEGADVAVDQRAEVTEALGDAQEVLGAFEAAESSYRGVLTLLDGAADGPAEAGDPRRITRVQRKVALTLQRQGRFAEARATYGTALVSASAIADPVTAAASRAEVRLRAAGLAYREGRFDDAEEDARAAAHDAVDGGVRRALARAFMLLDLARRAQDDDRTYEGWAAPIFAADGDLVGEGDALNNEGMAAFYAGRWDEALAAYERSEEVRRRAGDVMGQAMSANNIGEVLSDQGRLDQAEGRFASALRDWRAAGFPIGVALATSNLGRVHLRRGDTSRGRQLIEQALAMFTDLDAAQYVLEAAGRLAEADLADGHPDEACDRIALASQSLARGSLPAVEVWLRRLTGEGLLAAGRDEEGRSLLRTVIEDARNADMPYEEMRAAEALGLTDRAATLSEALGVRPPGA